jgi:thiamine kinase-like enzyme
MSIAKRTISEVLTESVREHPAVQAWRKVQSDSWEPGSLEVLQQRRYSSVYRISDIKQDGERVIAKRCRVATAHLEHSIYRELLPLTGMPTLRCHGILEESEGKYCWLFLEDAAGVRYTRQFPENRALAGRWLAELHLAAIPADLKLRLSNRELDHYLRLLRGCRATLLHQLDSKALPAEDAGVFRRLAVQLDALESLWDELEEICGVMPRTLVHGDFVDKNLRIRDAAMGPELLVFDWEYAGWGVPAADLAQFIDRVASPDLRLYGSILNREHFHGNLRDFQAFAACGNLLRMVDQMSWATVGQEFVLPTELVKTTALLRSYESSILGAISAFQGSRT